MRFKSKNRTITFFGSVTSGLGKGRYFMRQKCYRAQFLSKLRINPYYGTLNIKLSRLNAKHLHKIKRKSGITIKGFKKGGRKLGDVVCYRAELSGIKCALVVPKLSTHFDIAEIISAYKLRTKLKLKEGSIVKVSVLV